MYIKKIGLGVALLGVMCACEKDEEPVAFSAHLEVREPSTIGRTFATLNGSVTLDGTAVKEVGFIYWEAGNPGEKTTVEGDTLALSDVTARLEGLRMETEYEYQLFVGNGRSQKKSSVSRFATTRTSVPLLSEVSYDKTTNQLSASVKDDGIDGTGDMLEQKGFCWGTRANPTISGNMIEVEESGLDLRATLPDGLTETVYVRAFALNNLGLMAYGPTLRIAVGEEEPVEPGDSIEVKWALGEIAVLDSVARTFQGTIVTRGDSAVSAWGFCWNQAGGPTVEDSRQETDSTLVASLPGLLDNQTYYLRVYLVAGDSVIYSPELTFSYAVAQEVKEPTVSGVTLVDETNYLFSALVVSDGGVPVDRRGFCWNETGDPTLGDGGWTSADENFTAVLKDYLMPGKTYYIRAFATNEIGTGYGEVMTVTVKALSGTGVPVLDAVSRLDGDQFACAILDAGLSDVRYKGFCWSKESMEPTWNDVWSVFTTDAFSARIELSPGTYYVRAFAVNEAGVGYSDAIEVVVEQELSEYLPVLGDITPVEGVVNQYQCPIVDDRGAVISVRGYCWTTEPNVLPTIWSGRQEVDESFLFDATVLPDTVTYFVRAYVVTDSGEIVYSSSLAVRK